MNYNVSIWIGNFESMEELMDYTNIEYTEDGDSVSSMFERDFHLDYYERELVEKKWISQSTNNIRNLLKGFSYSEQFLKQLENSNYKQNINTAILIYNLKYDAKKTKIKYGNSKLEFLGFGEYIIAIDDRW